MTKAMWFISLKPEAIGAFSAHGDMNSVSAEVDEFIVKNGD
jgi:hypothetical protein